MKVNPEYKCLKCGHIYVPRERVRNPTCPECKSKRITISKKNGSNPFQIFNNEKYSLRQNGYYATTDDAKKYMHTEVWKHHRGRIPDGYEIHHRNHNKGDNRISNLMLIKKDKHAELFSTGSNQYKKRGYK